MVSCCLDAGESSDGLSTGVIAAIVVAVVLPVIVIAIIVLIVRRRTAQGVNHAV